jgi:hypothetical protein
LPEDDLQLPQWWSTAGVSALLTPRHAVVPVLGAGVSRGAQLPDAKQLAEWLAPRVQISGAPQDGASLFSVVDAVDPAQTSASDLQRIVAAHVESFPLQPTPFINELVHLPSRFIITLNYDDLVGFSAEQQGLQVLRLSAFDADELTEAHRRITNKSGEPPPELTILHLHGQARTPETVVLDSEAYRRLMRLQEINDIVFALTHSRALAIVGTRLDETYLLTKLQEQLNSPFHALFCREREATELTTGRAALSTRQHLKIIAYPDHPDLIVLPRWLNSPRPLRDASTPATTLDPATTPDPAEYIASEFREEPTRADVTESDILAGHRTVVVGVAGTGKTHLLSWLAAEADPERPAVRVRLADVPMGPGLPEAVLKAWAKGARASAGQPGIDIGVTALREDRLHFLLDGLDEVPNELQNTAATLIGQVAERFPQHAFTVTSRPLPALAVLGHGEDREDAAWRFVQLAPGAAWQRRYLADHELTIGQLQEVMPALSDMRELLQIPFFLTRTVELFDNGQLEGLRDVGELLERLVDFALTREEELLPLLDIEDARTWLSRVALATTIAGRRTATLDELKSVPVGEETVGDLVELINRLQLRLLLSEDEGQVRFSHRLLADELVAETLAATQPSDALLDALVPVVDQHLAGVRDDVVIAVSLLCLRSPAWREAVARRDALAAARSTPSDAPQADRDHAVELLWGTYREWDIWAWDRSAPDLIEDTEVIARLLRDGDPDGSRVAMLRSRLRDGNETEQGNAVRILTRVRPAGFDADLRMVLRDPGRNGVVIRQAAIAAADLDLTDLIDDIVDAMLKTSDSMIHQDGSIALETLTPNSRLLDIAVRLIPARGVDLFAGLAKKRMSPSDRIELARALGVAGVDVLSTDREDLAAAASEVTPTDTVVKAAACAAAFWGDETPAVEALLRTDSTATADGLLDALEHGAEWWEVARLARLADLGILRDAAIDEQILQAAEQALQFEALSEAEKDEIRRETQESWARTRAAARATHNQPAALAQLLRLTAGDTDAEIQTQAFSLRGQVKSLEEQDLLELRIRLARWWPAADFADLVVEDGGQFKIDPPAMAWLFLAPAAEMPVNDDQWAQIASNPMVTQEQSAWLRGQANDARLERAIPRLTSRPKAWLRFLDSCPAPPPEFVLVACASTVESNPDEPDHSTQLVQRLSELGGLDTARVWAERDAAAASALRPRLAAGGDLDAQRVLLHELLDDIRGGIAHPRDELAWVSSVQAPEFLESLFEILNLTYPPASDAPKSGWHVGDALTPTLEAIARIGTREAVARYDALLAHGDDRRWLREQRNQVATAVLRATGDTASPNAAAAAGVPYFDT